MLPSSYGLRKIIAAAAVLTLFLVVASCAALVKAFAGPVRSGALFLLLPGGARPHAHALPSDHQPLHKGAVDLQTGLYYRENDDLVVPGTPPLVLRRTYLSGYRVWRQFGIGATHSGEQSLIGDGEQFQWISLILATGSRIEFRRISSGASLGNAVFVHDETPSDYLGARLGWTGVNWVLRKRDGSLAVYRACGPRSSDTGGIIRSRTPDGRTVIYRRDGEGTLLRMESGPDRWIAFEYDGAGRVACAYTSLAEEVRCEYDGRGRLSRVVSNQGAERRYTYTERDELATISEPGTSIENQYTDGRCVRQINRFPDSEPFIFEFQYQVANGRIIQTDTERSDGTWTQYTWGGGGYLESEISGQHGGVEPVAFAYERDPVSRAVTALTVTCPDRGGRPLRHRSLVRGGNEEWIKRDLLRTHCSWSAWRRPRTE